MIKATQMMRHIGTRMGVRFTYRSPRIGHLFDILECIARVHEAKKAGFAEL